jgi:hypothetical protein
MAVVASFVMTILFATTGGWAFQQYGYNAPLSVLLWIFSPTTFFLSTTTLEYLDDGNIARSLKVSLFYTGLATALIIALYAVAAVASPRARLARYHLRPLSATERVASLGTALALYAEARPTASHWSHHLAALAVAS